MMEEQIELSNRSKSKGVETIIASFELGMTKREVTKAHAPNETKEASSSSQKINE